MAKIKKAVCNLLAGIIFVQLILPQAVFAADIGTQVPPGNLTVDALGVDESDSDDSDGNCFVDLKWDYPSSFFLPGASGTYLNVYNQQVPKHYKAGGNTRVLKEGGIQAQPSATTYTMSNLYSGTVYYADMTAYYKYTDGMKTSTGNESTASNRVKFMTDINIDAYTVGTNQIKIEWDDVWNTDGRINYKLYVSDSSDFKSAAANYIEADDIGTDKPVQVDETKGLLSYTYTVDNPGKVYYVKIVPVILDDNIKYYSEESETVSVSSYILATATKVSSTSDGTIWRLDWSPVIVGLSDSNITIQYEILRGKKDSSELPTRIQSVNNTSIYVVLKSGEEDTYYYIVRALVTDKNGADVYPGIEIVSGEITMEDMEVAATPPTPELVGTLGSESYEVTSDTIKILWEIPTKVTGEIDYNTYYDVWLSTDPNTINDDTELGDPVSWKLSNGATAFSDGSIKYSFAYVKNGTSTLGCALTISGVSPNTSYYFRIQARKIYLGYVDEVLTSIPYSSEPAVKTIVTPVDSDTSTPVAPPKPPLTIKEHPAGTDVVTSTAVTLQVKNKWYEKLDTSTNEWVYFSTVLSNVGAEVPDGFPTGDEYADGIIYGVNINNFRMLKYDSSIKLNVYYTKYDEAQNTKDQYGNSDISIYSPIEKSGFGTEANDAYENALLNYPDYVKHNVDLELTGLDPNTTYVMWVKAERTTTGSAVATDLLSEASDPILVTTLPNGENPTETPTVPVFNYYSAGDVYVDLGWNYDEKYIYYIKYSTKENLDSATDAGTVDPGENSYFRISGLTKDTLYYFWIQAEYVNTDGESAKSGWSDSYSVQTLAEIPPDTPLGFGIKSSDDAVTVSSITYEWLEVDGLEYILELADNSSYNNSVTYSAGGVSEYTADGLSSNVRYYARLYAYNPVNKLKSAPTASVAVKTLKSKDDYDSDQDNETVISGDYVVKGSSVIKGVWYIKIVGVNADRFIEHVKTDKVLDYYLDAGSPPVKGAQVDIMISGRVFTALSQMRENLIIIADGSQFTIKPEVLTPDILGNSTYLFDSLNMEIIINSPGSTVSNSNKNLTFKTAAIGIGVKANSSGSAITVDEFANPLSISIPFTAKNWYNAGKTIPLKYSPGVNEWLALSSASASYDTDSGKGNLTFGTMNPGEYAVADKGSSFFDDIYGSEFEASIINVATACELKSISGRQFKPDSNIGTSDAVKLVMDVLGYKYDANYMTAAVRAGIIRSEDSKNISKPAARECVIAMAVRTYEIKSSEKATPSGTSNAGYSDMSKVSSVFMQKVRYAAENGLLPQSWSTIQPKAAITRGEVMYMLEKVLALTGDIE